MLLYFARWMAFEVARFVQVCVPSNCDEMRLWVLVTHMLSWGGIPNTVLLAAEQTDLVHPLPGVPIHASSAAQWQNWVGVR